MAGVPLLVKAALPAIPGVNLIPGLRRSGGDLPDISLDRDDVVVDRAHVAAYAALCGFPRKDTLPLPYPHLLASTLHLRILTADTFPFPAVGTVHIRNAITQHRPIGAVEVLRVAARPAHLRTHPKGCAFDMVTTVRVGDELVWEETSTFLRRGATTAEGAQNRAPRDDASGPSRVALPAAPPTGTVWGLPGDLGRRYAAVSGDHNPIHLHQLTARLLGFRRHIAHGMWSLARCVGALENRLGDAVTVDAAFKRPILLPGRVAFGSRRLDDGYAFSLSAPGSGAPHLAGRTRDA